MHLIVFVLYNLKVCICKFLVFLISYFILRMKSSHYSDLSSHSIRFQSVLPWSTTLAYYWCHASKVFVLYNSNMYICKYFYILLYLRPCLTQTDGSASSRADPDTSPAPPESPQPCACKRHLERKRFFKWTNPGLFLIHFRPFLITISIIQIEICICNRWCAWESNPGPQNGRRR